MLRSARDPPGSNMGGWVGVPDQEQAGDMILLRACRVRGDAQLEALPVVVRLEVCALCAAVDGLQSQHLILHHPELLQEARYRINNSATGDINENKS